MPTQRFRSRLSPRVTAFVLYGAISCIGALAASMAMLTRFAPYDDEGTLLADLSVLVGGGVPYRDVYSPYGPFYFELFGSLFALTGQAVSTNAGRFIVIAIWVATSIILGFAAQRITGRLVLGAAAAAISFGPLGNLVAEPMHPIGLCILLLAVVCLLVTLGSRQRPLLHGGLLGLTLAALVLTKINLGIFAVAALVVSVVLVVPGLRPLRWPALVPFAAMPLMLMRSDLDEDWVRDLVFIATCSAVALLVAARAAVASSDDGAASARRWLVACVTAFASGVVLILGGIVATGATLGDVYDGVIVQATAGREIFVIAFGTVKSDDLWVVAGVTAAALASVMLKNPRNPLAGEPSAWAGVARIAAGLLIVGEIMVGLPVSPVVPMMLAWVAVIAPFPQHEDHGTQIARIFLPALAVAEALQVYPVAGSQTGFANVLFAPVGVLCIADGLRVLEGLAGAGRAAISADMSRMVAFGLTAAALWATILRPGVTAAIAYDTTPAVRLGGARFVHLPPDQAAGYERLVALIRGNCTQFVTYPGLNSLYLWSGIHPPRQTLPGGWMTHVDHERQAKVVREMRDSARPCVVRNNGLAANWVNAQPEPKTPLDGPLVKYVNDEFRLAEQVGDYQFMLPKTERAER